MEPNEYEEKWAEGEEAGPLVDAVLKAKRKDASDVRTADDEEFAKAFEEQPDVEEPKKDAAKP